MGNSFSVKNDASSEDENVLDGRDASSQSIWARSLFDRNRGWRCHGSPRTFVLHCVNIRCVFSPPHHTDHTELISFHPHARTLAVVSEALLNGIPPAACHAFHSPCGLFIVCWQPPLVASLDHRRTEKDTYTVIHSCSHSPLYLLPACPFGQTYPTTVCKLSR